MVNLDRRPTDHVAGSPQSGAMRCLRHGNPTFCDAEGRLRPSPALPCKKPPAIDGALAPNRLKHPDITQIRWVTRLSHFRRGSFDPFGLSSISGATRPPGSFIPVSYTHLTLPTIYS